MKEYKGKIKELQASPFYNAEIEEAVDVYLDFAIGLIEEARKNCKDPVVMVEQKLDFSQYVEGGFGTGDLVIAQDGTLEIVDLKGGKGVEVSAECNPQMQLYALGALTLFDCLYDIQKVRMSICQPRMDNISTYELSKDDLFAWANDVLKPAARQAWDGEGEFDPREYTCKFCKAKAICRARAEKSMDIARFEFRQAALLTKEEVTEILSRVSEIEAWCKDIWAFAEARAIDGEEFEGFKIVEGRSNRKYCDEDDVIKKLTESGYPEDAIYSRSLKGITALEKELGKNEFNQVLNGLIIKPPGKYTMVVSSDKREKVILKNAAEAEFKEEIENE